MTIRRFLFRIHLVLIAIILCGIVRAENDTPGRHESPDEQIYRLTVASKEYVEADQLDSALTVAFIADSLAKSGATVSDTAAAAAFNNLAYCYFRTENHETALAYLDSALAVLDRVKINQDSLLADIHCNYGRIYHQLSEYDRAIENYETALGLQEVALGPGHVEVATICNNLGIVKTNLGYYDEAEKLFFRTLDIWKTVLGADHPDVGLCLINLGYLYDDLGRYEEAEKCYLESLSIREKTLGPDHSSVGIIRVNLAALQVALGKNDPALMNLLKAKRIIGEALGERSIYYAQVIISVASMLINHQGDYAGGEALYREALSICAETLGPDHEFAASLYSHLADYNDMFGRRDIALDYNKKAADIILKVHGKNSIDYAVAIARVALSSTLMIGYTDAPLPDVDSIYNEYRTIIDQCGKSKIADYNSTLRIFAGALYNTGAYPEAARLLKEYLSNKEQAQNTLPIYGEIALMEYLTGNESDALALVDDLASRLDTADDRTWYTLAHCHTLVGELLLFSDHFDRALTHLEKTLHYQNLFLKTAFCNASQASKLALLNNATFVSYLPARLNRINTPRSTSLALKHTMMEKSYVINAITREHQLMQCSDDPDLNSIWEEYGNVSARTANLVRGDIHGGTDETSRKLINSLIKQRDSLETVMSNICGEHTRNSMNIEFETTDVARRLADDNVLIEYLRFVSTDSIVPEAILRMQKSYNYGAFVMDARGTIDFYDLGPVKPIDSLITLCREHIAHTGTKAVTPLGKTVEQQLTDINRALYNKIMAPFVYALEDKRRLIVAPDRNISLIPFDILPIDDSRYLIEKYEVTYVSSGMDLLDDGVAGKDRNGPILILADPDYECRLHPGSASTDNPAHASDERPERSPSDEDRDEGRCSLTGFERLPYTAREMRSIERLVNEFSDKQSLSYTGELAREKTLTSLERPPSALHIATHGFTCVPQGESLSDRYISPLFKSGLVLAGANNQPDPKLVETSSSFEDGILSAYEISALNLTGTELVVLSACESGVGEYVAGMGVMGMRSSFRQAGAESVIMSLWKVPDDLSARVMDGFYKRWLSGKSKINALRETSLELLHDARERYGNGHPIHWSGFILTGESE